MVCLRTGTDRSRILQPIILLSSVFSIQGFYLIKDYYMDRGQSKAFMGICGRRVEDGCAHINSHVNTFSLAKYSANQDCWMILDAGPEKDARFDIEFIHWELQPPDSDGECRKDYLEFYDGLLQKPRDLIVRFCGSQKPNTSQMVTHRHLTVKFVTDATDGYKGFRFTALKTQAPPCGADQFLCASVDRCIDSRLQCDGTAQCPDAQDEAHCSAWMQLIGGFMTLGLAGVIGFGIGIAGACLLLLVFVSCCCCCHKKKAKPEAQEKPKVPRIHLVENCEPKHACESAADEATPEKDKTQLVEKEQDA